MLRFLEVLKDSGPFRLGPLPPKPGAAKKLIEQQVRVWPCSLGRLVGSEAEMNWKRPKGSKGCHDIVCFQCALLIITILLPYSMIIFIMQCNVM